MDSRHLILLVMLVCPRLISFDQSDSRSDLKQVAINLDIVIQVGAFRNESNALALRDRLSALLNHQLIIVSENGYFKVRITGLTSPEDMEKLLPSLGLLGIKDLWVLPVKKQEEIKLQTVVQPDTVNKPISGNTALPVVAEEIPVVSQPTVALQVEVFHDESKALNAQKRITTKLNLSVEIVQEWEYYKVFVTGFYTTDEAKKYYPALAKLGYPNISLIKNYVMK